MKIDALQGKLDAAKDEVSDLEAMYNRESEHCDQLMEQAKTLHAQVERAREQNDVLKRKKDKTSHELRKKGNVFTAAIGALEKSQAEKDDVIRQIAEAGQSIKEEVNRYNHARLDSVGDANEPPAAASARAPAWGANGSRAATKARNAAYQKNMGQWAFSPRLLPEEHGAWGFSPRLLPEEHGAVGFSLPFSSPS